MLAKMISSCIMGFVIICVWTILYDKVVKLKKVQTYLYYAVLVIGIFLNYYYNTMSIKIMTIIILLAVINWLLYRKDLRETILATVYSEAIVFLSETIFSIIVVLTVPSENLENLMNSYFGVLFTNIVIAVIILFIIQFKFVKKLYDHLLKSTDKIKMKTLVTGTIFFVLGYNLIFFNTYNQSDFLTILIINTGLIVIYAIAMFKMIKSKNDFLAISSKYDVVLDSLKEYEKILDQYKVSNHENKNQLLTIRSMIVNKEKSIPKYIDNIIGDKIEDDEKLMFQTTTIPAGGLRAVIYSKILNMKKNNISFFLNVDKKIRTVDFIGLGDKLAYDVCKIISVYLDNAIDAVLPNKNGSISIEFYIEDQDLCIAIANTFVKIDINKIDAMGYTTKTKGHGYGLPLANKLIDRNSGYLKNERRITDDVFTQILKINIK